MTTNEVDLYDDIVGLFENSVNHKYFTLEDIISESI